MHFCWKKTKSLCRFLDIVAKSQSRISKKGFAQGRGQNAYSKTIPKQELTSRSPKGVQRGTLLALANDRSPKGVQRGTLLALVKIILLVNIYVQLYSKNNFPFQNPAYEVCSMERWSSNLGNVSINQMECLLWNPIRSSLCTGTSSPTWGCYRSDVLAWVKLQLPMSQGTTRVPLFGIKGRQNGFPC